MGASAAWKLKAKAMADYCSNDCTRKALYVKTQLSEVPAWERKRGEDPKVVLDADDRVPAVPVSGSAGRPIAAQRELALERGETMSSFRPNQVMTDSIVENAHVATPSTETPDAGTWSHRAIEGYQTVSTTESARVSPHFQAHLPDRTKSTSEETNDHNADEEEEESWREMFSNMDQR